MLRVQVHIPRPAAAFPPPEQIRLHRWKNAVLYWPYFLAASISGGHGLEVRWLIAAAALRRLARGQISMSEAYPFLFEPFDTVRHFEFSICWEWVRRRRARRALDLSSPRMLPFLLVTGGVAETVSMVNPDAADLRLSLELARALGIEEKISFQNADAARLEGSGVQCDIVTSLSVLEHIPTGEDQAAFAQLWTHTARGGCLIVTVPCARQPYEEFIDYNEYGLLEQDEHGFVFGQRYYDELGLEQLCAAAGRPAETRFYGESTPGDFVRNRAEKVSLWLPPKWREAWVTARSFRQFGSISDLPGIGVAAMRFEKR